MTSIIIPINLDIPHDVPHLHITLKYLGDFNEQLARQQLRKITFKPFQITISGQGQFKNSTHYLVQSKEILKLQNKIDKTFQQWFEPEKNFIPHLTISRTLTTLPEINTKIKIEKVEVYST